MITWRSRSKLPYPAKSLGKIVAKTEISEYLYWFFPILESVKSFLKTNSIPKFLFKFIERFYLIIFLSLNHILIFLLLYILQIYILEFFGNLLNFLFVKASEAFLYRILSEVPNSELHPETPYFSLILIFLFKIRWVKNIRCHVFQQSETRDVLHIDSHLLKSPPVIHHRPSKVLQLIFVLTSCQTWQQTWG